MLKRIYLAGPGVFYPDPLAECERLKSICKDNGLEGVFPLDAELDLSKMNKQDGARAIYDANIDLIRSCQGMMADMQAFRGPGMDGGTAFEMGYAKALGLKIVGYGCDGNYLDRTRRFYGKLMMQGSIETDPSGLMVEDFDIGDNLMMSCSADALVLNAEAAAAWLNDQF